MIIKDYLQHGKNHQLVQKRKTMVLYPHIFPYTYPDLLFSSLCHREIFSTELNSLATPIPPTPCQPWRYWYRDELLMGRLRFRIRPPAWTAVPLMVRSLKMSSGFRTRIGIYQVRGYSAECKLRNLDDNVSSLYTYNIAERGVKS